MADTHILDQVTLQFVHALQRDAAIIQFASKRLFYYLALIQLSISALWMSLAGESLQRLLMKMVQLAVSLSVFYALIHFGGVWIPEVLNGFIELGQQTGVQSLDPSSIVSQGVSISSGILKGFFNWGLLSHPFVSLIGAIVCISVLVLYGLIAAELTIVLIKSYIVIAVGGLFFAFSGSDTTKTMTKRYFQAVIGLGLQLMTIYMLLGVGQHIGNDWAHMTAQAAKQHALMPMLIILCAVVVYYMVLKNIPPFIAGLSGVGGFRSYGEAAIGAALGLGSDGARWLSQGFHRVGGSIQGSAQAVHSISQGVQSYSSSRQFHGMDVASSVGRSAGDVSASVAKGVKDVVMKNNAQLSFGQKVNRHLSNTIKKRRPV